MLKSSALALARGAPILQGSLRLIERDVLPPGPGEVVVRPRTAGVCGTDLQMLRGLRGDPAMIIGHEADGVIEAIGTGVCDLSIGDEVLFNPTCPLDQSIILGHNIEVFGKKPLPCRLLQ